MPALNYLITGASGFIGTRLAALLLASGASVTNVGRRPCKVTGVMNLLSPTLGILEFDALVPKNITYSGIFNLAAAGVNPGDRNAESIFQINSMLTPQLVGFAARRGIPAFVTTGSSAEYAPNATKCMLEETATLETGKLYGASKAAGGILALANGAHSGVEVGVLRLFNVFGAGEAPHRLFPHLIDKLKAGTAVDLSAGSQIRDFVYVDDVCNALIISIDALGNRAMPSGAYNVATGMECSVAGFARLVADAMQVNPDLLRFGALPLRPDDLPYVVGNPAKLQRASGWRPGAHLLDGILLAIEQLH